LCLKDEARAAPIPVVLAGTNEMFISALGALFFGLAVGWISYRTLRLTAGANVLSDIATIIGAVGSAAVITLLKSDVLFGWYGTGLAIGVFAYFAVGLILYRRQGVPPGQMPPVHPPVTPPDTNPTDAGDMRL
jgi:hypothetical protein